MYRGGACPPENLEQPLRYDPRTLIGSRLLHYEITATTKRCRPEAETAEVKAVERAQAIVGIHG